jgi:hypothetical protein
MKTPLYITIEDHEVYLGGGDIKTLPQGSFVKPIKFEYLPKHIKDRDNPSWFDPERYVYVYCHYGIVCVRWQILRKDD